MSTTKPTLAFFGATGGCTNACLIHTLRASHPCICLVRTPSKLRSQLTTQGIDNATIDRLVTFVEGNAHNIADVKRTLLSAGSKTLPDQIVTGLGAAPGLRFPTFRNWSPIYMDQPEICGKAANVLVSALKEIYEQNPNLRNGAKPALTFVSTTGITTGPADVPWSMRFLYHVILATPHVDKKKMEDVYRKESGGMFASVTGIRPTLLMGGIDVADAAGLQKVRAGTEAKPELGYTVKRADVGWWMYENVIRPEAVEGRWRGEMCSLTS